MKGLETNWKEVKSYFEYERDWQANPTIFNDKFFFINARIVKSNYYM